MDERKLDSLLQLSFKARKLKFGYENIDKVKGKAFIIVAKDLSENTKKHILKRFKGDIFTYKTKNELGNLFGKNEIGVIILPENEINLKIKEIFRRFF
jgi:ribosomal protein L7Ae-like RNA K-turn-binding protein